MRLAFGTDEETEVTRSLVEHLRKAGHFVAVVAPWEKWPEVGHAVGHAVVAGEADLGIVCCWTGTGVTMAANKVPGARCALCFDAESARGARRWNDANILAFSLRLASDAICREITDAFLITPSDPDERASIDVVEEIGVMSAIPGDYLTHEDG